MPPSPHSRDADDYLDNYRREVIKADPRLEDYQDIIGAYGQDYERAYQLFNTYYAEAYKDLSYYLGNQWSLEELSYLNNQRRSAFTYNKTRRIINLVQGYQRKNRLASVVVPIEDSSEQTAEQLSDVLQYVMQSAGGYEAISDAFKGALTTGMSFLSPYIDYRDDPISGDIKFHRDDWNAVILSPFFTKKDFSDTDFIQRRKFMSRSAVISMHPDKESQIMSLSYGTRDDKFTYLPYARQGTGTQRLLNYTEYWRMRWKPQNVLVDMMTGETHPWKGDRQRLEMFKLMHPNIEVIRKPVREVELAVIVEGELIHVSRNPFGLNDYPFVPFMAIWEPSYDLWEWKIQSLVRIIRDPQTEINKRRSAMVSMVDNQLKTGWKAKTNSVSNPSSLYKSGYNQVIFMKPESQMTDVEPIVPPEIPGSMFQLEAEFEKDMMEIAGVNNELFGMADDQKVDVAAVLSGMRQAAALVNLQDIFDGLRESQKLLAHKTLQLIQLNYTPEKVQLITKRPAAPEFFSKSWAKYDISVEEGLLTDTQRQTQFLQLSALKQAGVPIPDSLIIKNSNLHNKKELMQVLDAQAQAAKQQSDAAMNIQMQKAQSETEADHALAAERLNKIQLDAALSAERIARADEDRTGGILNLVRAVKELEGMDLDHVMKNIEILQELGAIESPELKAAKLKVANKPAPKAGRAAGRARAKTSSPSSRQPAVQGA